MLRVEKRANIPLVTLCHYVEASGGSILRAVYAKGEIELDRRAALALVRGR